MAGVRKTKKTDSSETVSNNKIECTCCGREINGERNFYTSASIINKNKGRLHVCKDCTLSICKSLVEESDDIQTGIYRLCRLLDYPYIETAYVSAVNECEFTEGVSVGINGQNVFKKYIKNINSLGQYSSLTFEDGDSIDKSEIAVIEESTDLTVTNRDKKNEEDCLKILGYDPFESENASDRKYLFNRLVDYLDDSTLEDNLLLMSVIDIVKGFCQLDKINAMIASATKDLAKLSKNTGNIKSLVDTKKNLWTTLLKIAEDNGISAKFNTTKSKGAGTLTGIMKKLEDIGLDDAKINLYDIQTSKAMRQIADISHQSIMAQLQLTESDYTDMIAEQKDIIYNLDQKASKAEEELRKLKVFIKSKGFDLDDIPTVVEADFETTEDNSNLNLGTNFHTELIENKSSDEENIEENNIYGYH